MPLSEHEQRLLEQMERAFYEEDPQFATAMQRPRVPMGRRAALAITGACLGLGIIVVGLTTRIPLVGVAGFALLLAAGSLVLRPTNVTADPSQTSATPAKKSRRSMSQRFEQRWEQRRGDGR